MNNARHILLLLVFLQGTLDLSLGQRPPQLPAPRRVTLLIRDQSGKPLPEAEIWNTGDPTKLDKTNTKGLVELFTKAPAVVVVKPKFKSQFVLLPADGILEVSLLGELPRREFPRCAPNQKYWQLRGWGSMFRIPKTKGFRIWPQANDNDYGHLLYGLAKDTWKLSYNFGIGHGTGGNWGYRPTNYDVWSLKKYEETIYADPWAEVIAARGETADGKFWRFLGRFGESLKYSDVDPDRAKALDQLLDRACISRP